MRQVKTFRQIDLQLAQEFLRGTSGDATGQMGMQFSFCQRTD